MAIPLLPGSCPVFMNSCTELSSNPVQLITSWHGPHRKHSFPLVSSSCCIIKNLLPSNGCCSIVCFLYSYVEGWRCSSLPPCIVLQGIQYNTGCMRSCGVSLELGCININTKTNEKKSQDSVVGIVMGYRLMARVWFLAGARLFFSPQRLDQLSGPPSLLFSAYQGLLP
jgi:hypothetical protein